MKRLLAILLIAASARAQQIADKCDPLRLSAVVKDGRGQWYLDGNWIGPETTLVQIADTGVFIFELLAVSDNGCSRSKKEAVRVVPCERLFIPNSFTPNGDGINDIYMPVGENISWSMEIYDQWGGMLYSGNSGWPGNGVSDLYAVKVIWFERGRLKQHIGKVHLIL